MNRSVLFALGIIVGIICLILAILWFVGHSPIPPHGKHVKHAILLLVIAVVAFLFAAANRPQTATV